MSRARLAWKVATFPVRVVLVLLGALVAGVCVACAIAWEDQGSDAAPDRKSKAPPHPLQGSSDQ